MPGTSYCKDPWTWSVVWTLVFFSDTIDVIVSSLAGSMVATHGLFKGLMKDEMKMAIGNTFLISQGLPAIKPRKLTESLFDLAAKCIKVIFKRIIFLLCYTQLS